MSPVLNLRCGSDIGPALKEGGVNGDFLEYSNPLCEGPLFLDPGSGEAIAARAAWMARRWQMDEKSIADDLAAEAEKLRHIGDYDHIRLWFEHDAYDQVILLYLLAWAASKPDMRARLSWIVINDHSEADPRFLGLGQLSPTALAALLDQFAPVPDAVFDQAAQIWPRLVAGEAAAILQDPDSTSALPFFHLALDRLMQDLSPHPLSDRLVLHAIKDGAETAGQVFQRLMRDLDPCPWYGDAMFLPVIKDLGQGDTALVTPVNDWTDPVHLTGLGKAVQGGQAPFPTQNNPARILAGLSRP